MAVPVKTGKLKTHLTTLDWEIPKWHEISSDQIIGSPIYPPFPDFEIYLRVGRNSKHLRIYVNGFFHLRSISPLLLKLCLIDARGRERFTVTKSGIVSDHTLLTVWEIGEINNANDYKDYLSLRYTLTFSEGCEVHNGPLQMEKLSLFTKTPETTQDQATQTEKQNYLETPTTKFLTTLSSDFEKIYENKTDNDFVLKTEDEQFPVHRAVLAARSEVFAAMFHHDTSESASGEVNIIDVNAETLGNVLQYVYSGKVRGLTVDTAISMFLAADKYAFLELRDHCLDFLLHNLTIRNICGAALLAHTHGEETLENEVVRFINDNASEVMCSEEWQEFFFNEIFDSRKDPANCFSSKTYN